MSPGLDPLLDDSVRRYEDSLVQLHDLLLGLPEPDAQRSPGKRAWSIAQCLEHLVISGGLICRRLEEEIGWARQMTRTVKDGRRARLSWFDRLYLLGVSRGRNGGPPRIRFPRPGMFDPGPGRPIPILTTEFIALEDRLITTARSAEGLDLAGIQVPSVVHRSIRVSLGGWFVAIACHQERHLDQATRTRHALGR